MVVTCCNFWLAISHTFSLVGKFWEGDSGGVSVVLGWRVFQPLPQCKNQVPTSKIFVKTQTKTTAERSPRRSFWKPWSLERLHSTIWRNPWTKESRRWNRMNATLGATKRTWWSNFKNFWGFPLIEFVLHVFKWFFTGEFRKLRICPHDALRIGLTYLNGFKRNMKLPVRCIQCLRCWFFVLSPGVKSRFWDMVVSWNRATPKSSIY